jgi:uncharacterized membrane-anchored protein
MRLSADALAGKVPLGWRSLATVVLLSLALLALVQQRASILKSGTEIRLRTVPVDPRDLFRGDYVVFAYEIGTVSATDDRAFRRGEQIYVTLRPGPDGFAQVAGMSRDRPTAPVGASFIAGRVTSNSCGRSNDGRAACGSQRLGVSYGIESYFVPQGQGLVIERTDKARIEVVAAVSASGEAAIKRLLIDGKPVYAEPPY